MRQVYVNGQIMPESEAKISVLDRGFLFADAVYEVAAVLGGRLIDYDGHVRRLKRSLDELEMRAPLPDEELLSTIRRVVELNTLNEGLVYLQVTRGAADRDFSYPDENVSPSLVIFTQAKSLLNNPLAKAGLKVVTVPDLRWQRRDIKTVQLLYPSMAKMAAKRRGADDAWLVEDELVTEGTSNNAFIVTADGTIVTRAISNSILSGITRAAILKVASEVGMRLVERPFSIREALAASEAFNTSASAFVMPVVQVDESPIGPGTVGPVALRLREIYISECIKSAL
jgi:D-alanine transaminase